MPLYFSKDRMSSIISFTLVEALSLFSVQVVVLLLDVLVIKTNKMERHIDSVILTCNTGLKYHHQATQILELIPPLLISIRSASAIRFTVGGLFQCENFGNVTYLKRTFVFSRRIALRDFGQLSPRIRLWFRQYTTDRESVSM